MKQLKSEKMRKALTVIIGLVCVIFMGSMFATKPETQSEELRAMRNNRYKILAPGNESGGSGNFLEKNREYKQQSLSQQLPVCTVNTVADIEHTNVVQSLKAVNIQRSIAAPTGDSTNFTPYIIGLVVALVLIVLVFVMKQRNRSSDDREDQNSENGDTKEDNGDEV